MRGIGRSYRASWSPSLTIPLFMNPSDLSQSRFVSVPIQPSPSQRSSLSGPFVRPSNWSSRAWAKTRLSITGGSRPGRVAGTLPDDCGDEPCALAAGVQKNDSSPTTTVPQRIKGDLASSAYQWNFARAFTTPPPCETFQLPCDKGDDSERPNGRAYARLP